MKYAVLFLSFFIFVSCGVQKIPLDELDTLIPVKLYATSNEYIQKTPMAVIAGVLTKEASRQHIKIKGFFDLNTGKKLNDVRFAWAIEYKGGVYFNLGYSSDVNHWNSFAKFDIEGRYCAVIINENSPNILKTTSNKYGGGIVGVLAQESHKWNKNWIDKYNLKVKILLVDTHDTIPKFGVSRKYIEGNYLTRKKLEEILEEMAITLTVEKTKDVKFEKVIEIIERANIKSLN